MLGFRNMWRVLRESRAASRRRATLAVVGDSPEAARLAELLGAQRNPGGAEIVVSVSGDGSLRVSGKGIEEPGELSVRIAPSMSEEELLAEVVPEAVSVLDEDYLIPLGSAYPVLRRAVCGALISSNALQNAVIGALPIPGADMPAITANQGRMVLGIAAVYGEELSMERARELVGVLAAGFGFRALARQLVKVVPVAGWLAAAAIGYAGTLALGRATVLYFERGKQELESSELAEISRRAREEARSYLSRLRR